MLRLRQNNTGRSSSTSCMYWLRELFWLSFVYQFHCVSVHIKSVDNVIPDYLSRFADPKRRPTCPPILTQELCCFRDRRLAETFEGKARELDG